MTSPPAISLSYTPSLVFDPLINAYKLLLPILSIPYPKANEGNNLSIHYIANAIFLVDSIILSINITRGPTVPNIKCKKNDATCALP